MRIARPRATDGLVAKRISRTCRNIPPKSVAPKAGRAPMSRRSFDLRPSTQPPGRGVSPRGACLPSAQDRAVPKPLLRVRSCGCASACDQWRHIPRACCEIDGAAEPRGRGRNRSRTRYQYAPQICHCGAEELIQHITLRDGAGFLAEQMTPFLAVVPPRSAPSVHRRRGRLPRLL